MYVTKCNLKIHDLWCRGKFVTIVIFENLWYTTFMGQDYKKLLNKKKKKYCDVKTMGVNIDKNEFYEIILSNSAHPENLKGSK